MPYSYSITDSNLYVTITAADDARVEDINHTLKQLDERMGGKIFQLFDADKITEPNHVYYAAANAYYAIEKGINISNKLDVETLLYVSAQNQISKAINLVGVSKETRRIAVIVISEIEKDNDAKRIADYLGNLNDDLLQPSQKKYEALRNLYEITQTTIDAVGGDKYKALTSLITEKGALISLKR